MRDTNNEETRLSARSIAHKTTGRKNTPQLDVSRKETTTPLPADWHAGYLLILSAAYRKESTSAVLLALLPKGSSQYHPIVLTTECRIRRVGMVFRQSSNDRWVSALSLL